MNHIHQCPCAATVTSRGTHGLSCKRSTGRSTRHRQINDVTWWVLKSVDVPATKEPSGLLRGDGKRLTRVPWQMPHMGCHSRGHPGQLLHANNIGNTLRAAEEAALRKRAEYTDIIQLHIYVPIAIETMTPINKDGQRFLDSLGECLYSLSGNPRETTFLNQRISLLIQIFYLVAFSGSFLT